jgi:hypothetical protein
VIVSMARADVLAAGLISSLTASTAHFLRAAARFGRFGTFAPFSRASLRPMAIACLRLVTFPPEPDRSVPRFRRRIALSTVDDAFLE